jgi:hypothetical protein
VHLIPFTVADGPLMAKKQRALSKTFPTTLSANKKPMATMGFLKLRNDVVAN